MKEMPKIEDVKEQLAKEHGYESYRDFERSISTHRIKLTAVSRATSFMDLVAIEYTKRVLDYVAENATTKQGHTISPKTLKPINKVYVDKESILKIKSELK